MRLVPSISSIRSVPERFADRLPRVSSRRLLPILKLGNLLDEAAGNQSGKVHPAELGFHLRHHLIYRDAGLGEPPILKAVAAVLQCPGPVCVGAASFDVAAEWHPTALAKWSLRAEHRASLSLAETGGRAPARSLRQCSPPRCEGTIHIQPRLDRFS